MPISKENRKRYPDNWKQISKDKIIQAGFKCQFCGLNQYAIGIRKGENFIKLGGSNMTDFYGYGYDPETNERITYKEARLISDDRTDNEDEHYSVIVLTVMHLDHIPENCSDNNLKVGCQRCHLMYDMPERIRKIKERKFKDNLKLFQ